jgi:hypothetical protein
MDNQVPKYVTHERAALLLGIPEEELTRISSEFELGHTEHAGDQKETFFTYEELRQICHLSAHHQYVANSESSEHTVHSNRASRSVSWVRQHVSKPSPLSI